MEHKYLVVVGIKGKSRDGLLPVIKKRMKMLTSDRKLTPEEVIDSAKIRDWIPADCRWYEVYELRPYSVEGCNPRRFDWRSPHGKRKVG
jgi:hypothetical protein